MKSPRTYLWTVAAAVDDEHNGIIIKQRTTKEDQDENEAITGDRELVWIIRDDDRQ